MPADHVVTEVHFYKILVISTTSLQQQTQQKQILKTVLNKESYKKIDISLIKTLSKFLQIDSLIKYILKQITACKVNSELLDFYSL